MIKDPLQNGNKNSVMLKDYLSTANQVNLKVEMICEGLAVKIQLAIVGNLRNGKFSEISKTLYESAKAAYPEFKQTGKFLVKLKSCLEEILAEKEMALLSNKQEVKISDHNQKPVSSTLEKTITAEKPKTFLNGTSIAKGICNTLGA